MIPSHEPFTLPAFLASAAAALARDGFVTGDHAFATGPGLAGYCEIIERELRLHHGYSGGPLHPGDFATAAGRRVEYLYDRQALPDSARRQRALAAWFGRAAAE
ncbi:MAG TPA: hypothetical protein VEH84_18055 [Alphaproteobacteria bacterium]|nr:hypothetical protein [Alphaproteobacteria bacterium]